MIILGQLDASPRYISLGILTVILVKGYDWFQAWMKNRRECEQAKLDAETELKKTEYLSQIASTNLMMSNNIATLNEKLQGDRALHDTMHRENLDKMSQICQFRKS